MCGTADGRKGKREGVGGVRAGEGETSGHQCDKHQYSIQKGQMLRSIRNMNY